MDSQGTPKIDPKSSQGRPKEAPGGAPEAFRKGGRKNSDVQTPLDSENEAPLSESSIFTFGKDPQQTQKIEPKWSQNGARIQPKTVRGRSKSVPEKVLKNSPEIGAKREPKWSPKVTKNRQKRVSKNEVDHRRAPGAPPGRYWTHFGTNFGDFFMCFSVFLCVYYDFLMKMCIFSCVCEDPALFFLRVLGMGFFRVFFVFPVGRKFVSRGRGSFRGKTYTA